MKLFKKSKFPWMYLFLFVIIITASSAKYLYNKYYKNYYLTVTGIVEYADGIGRQIIDLEELVGDEIEMNTTARVNSYSFTPERFKKVLDIKNKKLGYVILNEYSLSFKFMQDGNNQEYLYQQEKYKKRNFLNQIPREDQIYITYSMFESDRIPQHWVYRINKDWDMVVLPDPNLVDVYINSGVTKPIFVVPLGTNLQDHLNAPIKTQDHEIFTFANFSSLEERKNVFKLVEAYHKAFKGNDKVRLLLSARRDGGSYQKIKDYILNNEVLGVEIEVSPKDNDYYNFTFSQIDCYVSPSRGEGFSVIPREAMARGIPTIVSDALAQKTIAESGFVKVVNANTPVPAFFSHADSLLGNYYDVSTDDLANAMLDVYNNYKTYLDKSEDARSWAEKSQYKNLKKLYLNMLKPQKIILGDRNEITEEYLMTNSKELYNKFMNLKKKGII